MYIPKYTITNKILKDIGVIEAAKEVIENAPLVPYYEKQFQTDAFAKTVHHGTHIEGNELSFEQAKKVLEGETIVAHERDVQEIINYRNAMRLLDDLAKQHETYSTDLLLSIHRETVQKIVSEEKTGRLRQTTVVIREEGTGKIVFQPPPFFEVPYLLEEFFDWLNDRDARDTHPVLRAAVSHYILVTIHPFVEGNGRTVRAFANLVLMSEGYNLKRFFSVEEHFDADPAAYYEAFYKVDSQSTDLANRDLTPWLEYFIDVLAIELTKVKEKVRKLSVDSSLKGKLGTQVALTERQMKLVEYLTSQGSSTMQPLKSVLPMVSEDTILRDLKALVDKGIITKQGSTKASRYIVVK